MFLKKDCETKVIVIVIVPMSVCISLCSLFSLCSKLPDDQLKEKHNPYSLQWEDPVAPFCREGLCADMLWFHLSLWKRIVNTKIFWVITFMLKNRRL